MSDEQLEVFILLAVFMVFTMVSLGFVCFTFGKSQGYAAGYRLGLKVAAAWEKRAKRAEAERHTEPPVY